MHANYHLDIENSDSWGDADWLNFTRDRLVKMRAKRQPFDALWDSYEVQRNAVSFYDNNGELQANIPLEKTLWEIHMGRTNGKATFDIVPDWQADRNELEPTRYSMNFFLNGKWKDNFWEENKYMRENRWMYGSGIFFTGPRNYKDVQWNLKDNAEVSSNTDLLKQANFNRVMNETWFFFPKSIHPKDFFIDDNAYWQPNVQYADDCIYKEKVTATEFNNRYANNSAFVNTQTVQYWRDINPKNRDDTSIDVRHVILYHYFHRVTKKYIIMANENVIIYNGLYLYNDGKLPFVNIQFYANSNRFWGEGIPERVFYLKVYKSEILQDMLSGAAMSSWVHMIVGNDDQIGQDWQLWGRWLNLWRTTWGMDHPQQINTSPNLTYFSNVLELLDKYVITDSGINPMEAAETDAPTLWQQELIEANKSVRNSSVDENYNLGLWDAMTQMLDRIKQFAPALLKQTIKSKDGKVLKTIFPKITVPNMKIEKKNGKQIFTEDIGKFWYFELKPWIVQGIGVNIVTASSNSVLPLLDRQKITEYLNNIQSIMNIAQADASQKLMQQVISYIDIKGLFGWMSDAYGYDQDGLKANTTKDKIREDNLKKIQAIQQRILNASNPNTNPYAPTPWQTAPQVPASPAPVWTKWTAHVQIWQTPNLSQPQGPWIGGGINPMQATAWVGL